MTFREEELPLGPTGRPGVTVALNPSVPDDLPPPAVDANPFTPRFDKLVKDSMAKWHVPGLSLAVVHGQRKTYAKGYGIADMDPSSHLSTHTSSQTGLDEMSAAEYNQSLYLRTCRVPKKPIPVTPKTLFYAASTTKAFVAVSLAQVIEQNNSRTQDKADIRSESPALKSWDTPLSKLLPADFITQDDYWTNNLTVYDALTHRTGFPRHDQALRDTHEPESVSCPRYVARLMRHLPLSRPPRADWQYCNLMFIILHNLVPDHYAPLLKHLGLRSTFSAYGPSFYAAHQTGRLAHGYLYTASTDTYSETPWFDMRELAGAGDLISNVLDYAVWLRAWLSPDTSPMTSASDSTTSPSASPSSTGLKSLPLLPISLESRSHLLSPAMNISNVRRPPPGSPDLFYAAGWIVTYYRGYKVIYHTGSLPGFATLALFVPGLPVGNPSRSSGSGSGSVSDTDGSASVPSTPSTHDDGSDNYSAPHETSSTSHGEENNGLGIVLMSNAEGGTAVHEKLAWHLIDEALAVPAHERIDREAKAERGLREREARLRNAKSRLFPGVTTELPTALELQAYAGRYTDEGYGVIELVVVDDDDDPDSRGHENANEDGVAAEHGEEAASGPQPSKERRKRLHASVLARTWPYTLDFEHISSEHFLVHHRTLWTHDDAEFKTKASFEVGANGEVERMRLGFEGDVSTETITFEKLRETKH